MIKTIFLAAWSNRTPFWKFLIKHIAQLYFTPWLGHNIIIAKGGFLAFFRWFSFSSWLLHLFNVLTRARVYTTVIWLKNCRKIIHNLIPDSMNSTRRHRLLKKYSLTLRKFYRRFNLGTRLILLFFLVFHNADFQHLKMRRWGQKMSSSTFGLRMFQSAQLEPKRVQIGVLKRAIILWKPN